jgi:hypothetical protein
MEEQIGELKKSFMKLIDLRTEVHATFVGLNNIVNKLNTIYADFITKSQDKVLIFGLDSLRFQSKLIGIEYEDMKRLFYAINNRMYCEYYKLYKIIMDYIVENVSDSKIVEMVKSDVYVFPVYKDLEPFKQYDFDTIQRVHEAILIFLNSLSSYITSKEQELKSHQTTNKSGLNIDNFVMSFNYNLVVIKEKVSLFINYVVFFHTSHLKLLTRFVMKVNLMMKHVKSDINLEGVSKSKRKKILDKVLTSEDGSQILIDPATLEMSDNEDAYSTDIDTQDALESPRVIVNMDNFKTPTEL